MMGPAYAMGRHESTLNPFEARTPAQAVVLKPSYNEKDYRIAAPICFAAPVANRLAQFCPLSLIDKSFGLAR
jgi:hypothetical protein